MTSAIIMAGGGGARSGQSVPKQFLTVNDVPVIVYTMMNLQSIAMIDKMIVVGPAGWENFIWTYAQQFGITKLEKVITGGETRNQSIYNGLCFLKEDGKTDKVCLADANRPLVPQKIFEDVITLADQCDLALATEPCYDSMFVSEDGMTLEQNARRDNLVRGYTPECAKLSSLLELYEDAKILKDPSLSTTGLAVEKGKKVISVRGHIKCFKITTADDFELFKALLSQEPMHNLRHG